MRILVVRTDFLGDGVLTSPFIKMLKSSIADIENSCIDLLCCAYNFPAFQHNSLINNKYILKSNLKNSSSNSNKEVLKVVAENHYDAIFVCNRDYNTYKLLRGIKTKYVFGHLLGKKSWRSRLFCQFSIFVSKYFTSKYHFISYNNNQHEVINLFELLKLGLQKLNVKANLQLDHNCYFYLPDSSYKDTSKVNLTHVKFEVSEQRLPQKVVVNISGKREPFLKYLPFSLAFSIIEELLKKDAEVLIITTQEDIIIASKLLDKFSLNQKLSYLVESELMKLANRISTYSYFIGADGGLIHVAAGLGLRCVALFDNQNMQGWHPWSLQQVSIQAPSKRLYDITADEVMNALDQLNFG